MRAEVLSTDPGNRSVENAGRGTCRRTWETACLRARLGDRSLWLVCIFMGSDVPQGHSGLLTRAALRRLSWLAAGHVVKELLA
jgi:hypothetical protein